MASSTKLVLRYSLRMPSLAARLARAIAPFDCAMDNSPMIFDAIISSVRWRISIGVTRLARSARLSDLNVTRVNALAISGSVRQRLLVSSWPSSGRSGFPMIAGAELTEHAFHAADRVAHEYRI